MDYFLVDYENIGTEGLKNLSRLNSGDSIVLFYSDQCRNISLEVIDHIIKMKLQYSCFKVKNGTKNALDFHLCTYLGYLIKQSGAESSYFIISRDKGYDCLIDYGKELGVDVQRIELSEDPKVVKTEVKTPVKPTTKQKPNKATPTPKQSKVKESDKATLQEIGNFIAKAENPSEVLKIFNQYKTKMAINSGLLKLFKDSKKAGTVYGKLKPLMKAKNKS
ncbi:MAG: hypothetical protein K6E47_13135 [Lachnospiraceae bacterium]|nr:hypothetical protein [Lachnospiraceae bacterium]